MDIDDTQVLVLSDSYQSDDDNSQERKLVAHLKVYQQKELSETLYPVYEGETLIGRDPEICNIHIPVKALSKEHACIIVRGENHLIYDKTSRNKTRKGKLFLKPDVRYSLEDGDEITFADIRCSYIYLKTPHDNEETDNNLGDSPLKSSNNNNNPSQDESVHYELDEEELSSDILQPTQAGGLLGPLYHPSQATQLYVADSEDENQTAMNNENPAYIPNSDQSDAELETKKDKIEESTLQYELITGKNKDNVNNDSSSCAMASGSSGEVDQVNNLNEEIRKGSIDVAPTSTKIIATDLEAAMDTLYYDMDLDVTQTADVNPEEKEPKQVNVVPDSQSQMLTQTYVANENEEDATATQTFKDPFMEGPAAVLNTDRSTMAFDYSSDEDESQVFLSHHIVDDRGKPATLPQASSERNSPTNKTISTTKNDERVDTPILTEADAIEVSQRSDTTQVLTEGDVSQFSEKSQATQALTEDDVTQISEQSDGSQMPTQTSCVPDVKQILMDDDTNENFETSDGTHVLKESIVTKISEQSDTVQLHSDGDVTHLPGTSDTKQMSTEDDGNKTSEKSSDLQMSDRFGHIRASESSLPTQVLLEADGSDPSGTTLMLTNIEATQLVQHTEESDNEASSEIFIAETQPYEQTDKDIEDSPESACDKKSLIVDETPDVVRHIPFTEIGSNEATQNLEVSVDERPVTSKDKVTVVQDSEDTTQILDDTQLIKNDTDDIPSLYVTSPLAQRHSLSPNPDETLDATQILDSTHTQNCQMVVVSPILTVSLPIFSGDRSESKHTNQDLESSHIFDPAGDESPCPSIQKSARKRLQPSDCGNTSDDDIRELELLQNIPSSAQTATTSSTPVITGITEKVKPSEEKNSLPKDKSSDCSDEHKAELPDNEDTQMASTQAYGEEASDAMDTQPYGDQKTIVQISPADSKSPEIQKPKGTKKGEQPKKPKLRQTKRSEIAKGLHNDDSHDGGCEENKDNESKEIKYQRMTRRSQSKGVSASSEQKVRKGGRRSTKAKELSGSDGVKVDSSNRVIPTEVGENQGEVEDINNTPVPIGHSIDGTKPDRQSKPREKVVADLSPQLESSEKTKCQDLTDDCRTPSGENNDEQMASTQAYGEVTGDIADTQPCGDQADNVPISADNIVSPEKQKSRRKTKSCQQSITKKEATPTKRGELAKKVSSDGADDDDGQKKKESKNQEDKAMRKTTLKTRRSKIGDMDVSQKGNVEKSQSRKRRSTKSNPAKEEKDKIEATSVQIGRVKSRISGKTRQNAELTTSMTEESAGEHSGYRISPKVHHSPIKCDKDIVVLLEPLTDKDYLSPDKKSLRADNRVPTEDDHIACTQAYGEETTEVMDTQPYGDQTSPGDTKSPEVQNTRRSKRSRQTITRNKGRQTKRMKVVREAPGADDGGDDQVDDDKRENDSKNKGRRSVRIARRSLTESEDKIISEKQERGRGRESKIKQTSDVDLGPVPTATTSGTRSRHQKKLEETKGTNKETLEHSLSITTDRSPQQHIDKYEEPIVLLERVESGDTFFGEQSFLALEKTSDKKKKKGKTYSRLSLRKRGRTVGVDSGHETSQSCIANIDQSRIPEHSEEKQLKTIKQEPGQNVDVNVKSTSKSKTRKRKIAKESHEDDCSRNTSAGDNGQPLIKKERIWVQVEEETYEEDVVNIKTEVATDTGGLYGVFERKTMRRRSKLTDDAAPLVSSAELPKSASLKRGKRTARKRGQLGEASQSGVVENTASQDAVEERPAMQRGRKKKGANLKLSLEPEVLNRQQIGGDEGGGIQDDFQVPGSSKIQKSKQTGPKRNDEHMSAGQPKNVRVKRANKNCSSVESDGCDLEADNEVVKQVESASGKRILNETRVKSSKAASNVHSNPKKSSKRQQVFRQNTDRPGPGKSLKEQHSNEKRQRISPKSPTTPRQKMSRVSMVACSPTLRKRTLESKPRVMFTGVSNNRVEKMVTSLGGTLVSFIEECTHLVTDKVRRTVKFLCAVAKGIPIVSPLWLESCKTAGYFLDASNFLIEDKASEKQYKFSLPSSLKAASEHRMLDGYKIHVTKSVVPDVKQMKEIITSAGGELLTRMPTVADVNTIIISCPKDQAKCKTARKRSIAVVNAEFLLTGILQQVVDVDAYNL